MNISDYGSLAMDEELENFLRERRARVAEDKARLEQDPPYMEIMTNHQRAYGSTLKENIPPKSSAQGKEESCSVGLPLGVEYERKKQRLQQERRMDFRRYIAQKKQFAEPGPLIHLYNRTSVKDDDQTGVLRKRRPASLRDAATLTEDSRVLYRPSLRTEVKAHRPDEQQSSALPRHYDRLGRPVDLESEEELELKLMEGRRRRHSGVEVNFDKRRSSKTDGREKTENAVGVTEGRKSKTLTKNEDEEFATGLIIGVLDTEDSLKRRKERYRQELQEQIAEQHRNKKKEKDLELKVAATGANDPEKQPNRIRQFGLSRRKAHQVLEPLTTREGETSTRGAANHEKINVRDREIPPPEQPHVAFQSPLLEYSSVLEGGGLSPNSQPAAPCFPRTMDIPRVPWFPPPPDLSEAYRSPYGEPHHYDGSRNLFDPKMAHYGHFSVPGGGPLMSYWNVPPVGAVPNQFGNHSPHSPHSRRSGSSFPEPPIKAHNEAAGHYLPSDPSRARAVRYRQDLQQQIQEQQERKLQEKEEEKLYEAQLEADMKSHQPWGRGGGGAPLRDSTGNLIADLNQMHKLNEEAYSNPEQRQKRAVAAMTVRRPELADPNERVSGFTHVQTPQFARGNVFANQPTQQQLLEQDKYKAYLKHQIDEKMRKKAEEREQMRLEEAKEEKRLAEQRAHIQREYEEEQEKKKRKEMQQKTKNEELVHLAEQRRKEAERKKKEAEEKDNTALRRQYEREVQREPSPPIPTLQRKQGPHQTTPRPPTVDSQHSTAHLSERSLSGLQSPPVQAHRKKLRAADDQRDVISVLSALRRQIRCEQRRLEARLQQVDREELESPLSDGHQERPLVDVFDMARLRRQVPVRRPNSLKMEPRNMQRIHNSLQLHHTDGETRLGFGEVDILEDIGVASRRRRDYKDPHQQLCSQRSTAPDEYFDLSPPQSNYLRSMKKSARGSLLDSESAFIDPLGNAFPAPCTPELEITPMLSARERRRLAKQSQQLQLQDKAASSQPFEQHHDYTGNVLQQAADPSGHARNQDRTARLTALSSHGNSAGTLDLSDDDSVTTDLWMRPGTSDTLKCLDRPSRRERLMT